MRLVPILAALICLTTACTHRSGSPLTASEAPIPDPSLTVAELLARADRAATEGPSGRETLAAALASLDLLGARPADPQDDPRSLWQQQIPAAEVPPMRGRILGPAYRRGRLSAGATFAMDQLFDGGKQAHVAVATPIAAPVSMSITDGAGKSICEGKPGNRGQCSWTPLFSGRHQIVLSNRSTTDATYYLVID